MNGVAAAVLAGGMVSGGAGAAYADPSPCPPALPTEEAVDGLAATGLTVERGSTPQPFAAQILGRIADGIAPGIDMIVAELDSPAIDRANGMWAGMSGSPVYAQDGRLIGATSYGLSVGPSRIAGITPAADIYALLDPLPGGRRAAVTPADKVPLTQRMQQKARRTGVSAAAASGGLERLPLPIAASGLRTARLDAVGERLGLSDARLYSAGTPSAGVADVSDIVAGGNFAAALSYGDFGAIHGVGTTTAVCGSQALAFGHPMLFSGVATFSAHGASAVIVQPGTVAPPYKVANPNGPVGTVNEDRTAGVRAELGSVPSGIPVDIAATADGNALAGTTRINAGHLLPALAEAAALSAFDRAFDRIGAGSGSVAYTVSGTRSGGDAWTVTEQDRFADPADVTLPAAFSLGEALTTVTDNRFEEVTVDRVEVTADLDSTYRSYFVDDVQLSTDGETYVPLVADHEVNVQAGATLSLRVHLGPYKGRGGARTVELAVAVPDDVGNALGALQVAGGAWAEGSSDEPPQPRSFAEVLDGLANGHHNDEVRATLSISEAEEGGPQVDFTDAERTDQVVDGGLEVAVNVVDSVDVARLAGRDRYGTAMAVSQDTWAADAARAVVLALGNRYADGVAGAPLAAAKRGPLLLTQPDALTPSTAAEIDRVLAPGKTVYVLGGPTVLGPGVVADLQNAGYVVRRLAGGDRYDTALAIATETDATPDVVMVATGTDYADALAAGAAVAGRGVVVLSRGTGLTAATERYVDAAADRGAEIVAVGAAAAEAVADYSTDDVVGENRFHTAALLAASMLDADSGETVGIAGGYAYADGVAGAAHAAAQGGPLLLTAPDGLPEEAATVLQKHGGQLARVFVYGDESAVPGAVVDEVLGVFAPDEDGARP